MNDNGKLHLISLPIGNIDDITLRALQTIQEVDLILAEDTRQIIKFAKLREITVPQVWSYRDQTHEHSLPNILERLSAGNQIALVSDRGTPTISDPGYKLVRDVIDAGFEVTAEPGVSAIVMALSISGLPTDRFAFLGFLPRTAGRQKRILEEYKDIETTLVMYESPFRVAKLLKNIQEVFGDKVEVALAHELTKLNEGVIRGRIQDVLTKIESKRLKGEWVVMIRCN